MPASNNAKRYRQFGLTLLAMWISAAVVTTKLLHGQSESPYSLVSIQGAFRLVWNYPFEAVQALRFNNIRFVGVVNGWPGDIASQMNAAYNDLPAGGGVIYGLPNPKGGSWQTSGKVLFTTANKPVLLTGIGIAGNQQNHGGFIIEYTVTSPGCAIMEDYTNTSGSNTMAHGLRDLSLWNGHRFVAGGSGSAASGVCIGSTNGGAGQAEYTNINVEGFGIGYNGSSGAEVGWGSTFRNSRFVYNTIGISGGPWENLSIFGGQLISNGTGFVSTTNTELYAFGVSWDGNTSLAVDYAGTVSPTTADFIGNHFENPGCTSGNQIRGTANFHLFGGIVENDCPGGNINWYFSFSGFSAYVSGLELLSAGQTATQVFLINRPARAFISPVNYSPRILTRLVGGDNGVNTTVEPINANASNEPANWVVEAQSLEINGGLPKCSTAGTGIESSCVASIGSTNTAGTLQITTGITPSSSGSITLSFTSAIAPHLQTCIGGLNNSGAATWNSRATVISQPNNSAAEVWNWDNNSINLTGKTTYRFDYICIMK